MKLIENSIKYIFIKVIKYITSFFSQLKCNIIYRNFDKPNNNKKNQ